MAKKPENPSPRLAKALAAALPSPAQSHARAERVLVALSTEERDTIAAVADARREPLATTVRTLAVTAAEIVLAQSRK